MPTPNTPLEIQVKGIINRYFDREKKMIAETINYCLDHDVRYLGECAFCDNEMQLNEDVYIF